MTLGPRRRCQCSTQWHLCRAEVHPSVHTLQCLNRLIPMTNTGAAVCTAELPETVKAKCCSVERLLSLGPPRCIVALLQPTCSAWSHGALRPVCRIHSRFCLQTPASVRAAHSFRIQKMQPRLHTQMRHNAEETMRLRSSCTLHRPHQCCHDIGKNVSSVRELNPHPAKKPAKLVGGKTARSSEELEMSCHSAQVCR